MKDDFKMTIVYINVNEFKNQNTKELTCLWAFDVINRFTGFYSDFASESDTKSIDETKIGIIRPTYPRFESKALQKIFFCQSSLKKIKHNMESD